MYKWQTQIVLVLFAPLLDSWMTNRWRKTTFTAPNAQEPFLWAKSPHRFIFVESIPRWDGNVDPNYPIGSIVGCNYPDPNVPPIWEIPKRKWVYIYIYIYINIYKNELYIWVIYIYELYKHNPQESYLENNQPTYPFGYHMRPPLSWTDVFPTATETTSVRRRYGKIPWFCGAENSINLRDDNYGYTPYGYRNLFSIRVYIHI